MANYHWRDKSKLHKQGVVKRIMVGVCSFLYACSVFANPVLNNLGSGNVAIQQTPSTETITQSSQKAILNWKSFNIGNSEVTHFQQPAGGVALNNIDGSQGAAQIYGHLTATGRIILINPAGIYFGPNSFVSVGSIIASTAAISDQDFLHGYYNFSHSSSYNGAIVSEGQIIAAKNGLIALIGGAVSNNGMIRANMGHAILASGNAFVMSFAGNDLINFNVTQSISQRAVDRTGHALSYGVSNTDKIIADGGQVLISAMSAAGVLDNAINIHGLVSARSVYKSGGSIIISTSPNSGVINIAGKLDVSGKRVHQTGGNISITGKNILLTPTAFFDASGAAGGGNVLIGGDAHGAGPLLNANAVVMQSGARILADAITSGNGGHVVLWSNNYTNAAGYISAQGGAQSGNGGLIETSSSNILDVGNLTVNTSAANGATGQWLLDPYNITITAATNSGGSFSGGNPNIFTPTATSSISAATINTNLNSASIIISTGGSGSAGSDAGNIIVNGTADAGGAAAISWTTANALTLSAYNNITIDAGATIHSTNAGSSLNLIANNSAATDVGSGSGVVTNNGTLTVAGPVNVYYNPTVYTAPVTYTNTGGAVTAYMLINNLTDLQNMNTNLTGTYALNTNIDATATISWNSGAGFAPLGAGSAATSFRGKFNGQNYVINNLYIYRPATSFVGLFGSDLGTGTSISYVGLTNVNITGASGVGALVGQNSNGTSLLGFSGGSGAYVGNITSNMTNVYATGSVTGSGAAIGGLIGLNSLGTINNSYTAVNVTAGGNKYYVGGFTGDNYGTLQNDYASGNVTYTGTGTGVGGFTGGQFNGFISACYSSGTVTTTVGASNIGGFIGWSQTATGISYSYSISNMIAHNSSNIGGFVGLDDIGGASPILNSYSSGSVTGSGNTNIGGFAGALNSGALSNTNLWDTQSSGISTSAGGPVGKTTAQMMTLSTFTGAGWSGTAGVAGSINSTVLTGSTQPNYTWFLFAGATRPMLMMEYNTTIINAHQLQLAGSTLGANYKLGRNINLSSVLTNTSDVWGTNYHTPTGAGFDPIGASANYTGTFNGMGYTISNLYINRPSANNVGLFGQTSAAATIENVSLSGGSVSGLGEVGGLVGSNNGTIETGVTVSDSVSGAGSEIGGIAGYNDGTISGVSGTPITASGTVTGSGVSGNDVGGMVGYNAAAGLLTYLTSLAANTVSESAGSSYSDVGGIVGVDSSTSIISNVRNAAVVTGLTQIGGVIGAINVAGGALTGATNSGAVTGQSGGNSVGGIAGYNSGTIDNSSNSAAVTGNTYAGGIAGFLGVGSTLRDVYSTGAISGISEIGGLSGRNEGTVTATVMGLTYSTGSVTGTSSTAQNYLGGIVGRNWVGLGVISNVYNSGTVSSVNNVYSYVGGIAGFNGVASVISHSYNIGNVAGNTYVGGVDGDNSGIITNAHNTGNVNGINQVGGVIGFADFPTSALTNVYSTGAISGVTKVGGIAGENFGVITATVPGGTYASGTVTGTSTTTQSYLGGLVGLNGPNNAALISNSYNAATVSSINNNYTDVGGIAGAMGLGVFGTSSTITNSYNIGNVSGGINVGGIVGNIYTTGATVSSGYSTGNVTGILNVGGIAGNNTGSVTNVYSVANITGNTNVGGLIGYNTGTLTATSSGLTYASGNVTGSDNVGGGIGWNAGNVNNASFSGNVSGIGMVGAFIANENAGGSYTNTSIRNTTLTGLPGNNYFTLNVNQILNNIPVNGTMSGNNTLDFTGYANTVVASMSGTNNGVAVANGIWIATYHYIGTLTGNPGFNNTLIPTTRDYPYLIRTSATSGYFTDPLTYTSFYVAPYLGGFATQGIGMTFNQTLAGPISTINQGSYESNAAASNVPYIQVNTSPQWLIIGDQQFTIINNLERPVMIQNGFIDTDGMENMMLPISPYRSLIVQIINDMGNTPAAKTSLLQPHCGAGKVCVKELSFY